MLIIELVEYIFLAVMFVLLGYQALLSIAALFGRKIQSFQSQKKRKFALVVFLPNEEKELSKTLYSLFGVVYPKNLYDVIVVVDNPSRNVTKIAHNLGAIVLELTSQKEQSRGAPLCWVFEQVMRMGVEYDALIVFNTHGMVSGNYLEVMNFYLEKGSKVIQSSDLVFPQSNQWIKEFKRASFLLSNYVKPLGRKALGFGTCLNGSGMCFSFDILRENPWQNWSLTEDSEVGLVLQVQEIEINFAPEASVWIKSPNLVDQADWRRKCWNRSTYALKKFAPIFFKKLTKDPSVKRLFAFIDFVTPSLLKVSLFVTAMFSISALLWFFSGLPVYFMGAWLSLILITLVHLLVGIYGAGADPNIFESILLTPLYVLRKLKANLNGASRDEDKKVIKQ